MNKNVLTVFVVILTPIIILGVLAVAGAENFEKEKKAAEESGHTGNVTESASVLVPMETQKIYNLQSSDVLMSSGVRSLA